MRRFQAVSKISLLVLCASLLMSATYARGSRRITTDGTPALKDSTIWSATTYEAASKDVNKLALSKGRAETVTGEVVDVSCYLQLGKRGAAHIECGSKCIANGQPIGLLDKDENLFILFAEEHHPRRDGQADLKTIFAPLLSRTVTVAGTVTKVRGYEALFVKSNVVPDTTATN